MKHEERQAIEGGWHYIIHRQYRSLVIQIWKHKAQKNSIVITPKDDWLTNLIFSKSESLFESKGIVRLWKKARSIAKNNIKSCLENQEGERIPFEDEPTYGLLTNTRLWLLMGFLMLLSATAWVSAIMFWVDKLSE